MNPEAVDLVNDNENNPPARAGNVQVLMMRETRGVSTWSRTSVAGGKSKKIRQYSSRTTCSIIASATRVSPSKPLSVKMPPRALREARNEPSQSLWMKILRRALPLGIQGAAICYTVVYIFYSAMYGLHWKCISYHTSVRGDLTYTFTSIHAIGLHYTIDLAQCPACQEKMEYRLEVTGWAHFDSALRRDQTARSSDAVRHQWLRIILMYYCF